MATMNEMTGRMTSRSGRLRGNTPDERCKEWKDYFSSLLGSPPVASNPDEDAVSYYHCALAGFRSFKDTICLAVNINNCAIGTAAFSYLGPKLWNDLPIFICTASSVCQ